MGLSFRDAATMLAMLEGHMGGDKAKVEHFIREALAKEIGGKGTKETWKRMLELLEDSKAKIIEA